LKTDKLSVAIKHYTDFAVAVQEGRLEGPDEKLLREELLALRIMQNGKIDHMRQGYKDLSDATCGAIFNAIALTPRVQNQVVEVRTYKDVRKQVVNDTVQKQLEDQAARNVIRASEKCQRVLPTGCQESRRYELQLCRPARTAAAEVHDRRCGGGHVDRLPNDLLQSNGIDC
jgi:hypothetical protein